MKKLDLYSFNDLDFFAQSEVLKNFFDERNAYTLSVIDYDDLFSSFKARRKRSVKNALSFMLQKFNNYDYKFLESGRVVSWFFCKNPAEPETFEIHGNEAFFGFKKILPTKYQTFLNGRTALYGCAEQEQYKSKGQNLTSLFLYTFDELLERSKRQALHNFSSSDFFGYNYQSYNAEFKKEVKNFPITKNPELLEAQEYFKKQNFLFMIDGVQFPFSNLDDL